MQIYVNSELVKPNAIHIWNSSAQLWEEDKIGYVRVNGEWFPFIEYMEWIYDEGVEFYTFGLITGAGHYFKKEINHMQLSPSGDNIGVIGPIVSIDITNYNKLYIDWDVFSVTGRSGSFRVTSDYNGNRTLASVSRTGYFDHKRNINEIDLSDLTGDVYVRVWIRSFGDSSSLKVYKIWLE